MCFILFEYGFSCFTWFDWLMIIKSPHFVWEKYRCSIASGGLEPFGELFTELGNEALWPMVVCMACYDCVSISLASV